MSYCRWSSDDYQCDVYVYHDVHGGWTTHVAGRRHVPPEPLPEPVAYRDDPGGWMERHTAVMKLLDRAKLVAIGLPHDGERYNDPTPGAAADRLERLREAGYNVPQYAIDALRGEQRDICEGVEP